MSSPISTRHDNDSYEMLHQEALPQSPEVEPFSQGADGNNENSLKQAEELEIFDILDNQSHTHSFVGDSYSPLKDDDSVAKGSMNAFETVTEEMQLVSS